MTPDNILDLEEELIILEDPENFSAGATYCYRENTSELHEEAEGTGCPSKNETSETKLIHS